MRGVGSRCRYLSLRVPKYIVQGFLICNQHSQGNKAVRFSVVVIIQKAWCWLSASSQRSVCASPECPRTEREHLLCRRLLQRSSFQSVWLQTQRSSSAWDAGNGIVPIVITVIVSVKIPIRILIIEHVKTLVLVIVIKVSVRYSIFGAPFSEILAAALLNQKVRMQPSFKV